MSGLTHLDAEGRATMVDVSAKETSERIAVARALVTIDGPTAQVISDGQMPKGDVVAVARVAAIQAAKKTSELIPLCHQLPLSSVAVDITVDVAAGTVEVITTAKTVAQTGVEMEALTAASVAALTIYDMVKARVRGATIGPVELLEKQGGRSGHWKAER